MSEINWWGASPDNVRPQITPEGDKSSEIERVESIRESDRVRARVAVMRGESELYFIKIPPDVNMLETRPAGKDLYEVVYHDIVYGYTNNPHVFGAPGSPET